MKENDKKVISDEKPKEETYYVQGLGKVTYVGELDIEKLIKRLLKSQYITGK